MRAWSVLRQFLAAALCAVLAFPAFSTVPPSGSTPSNAYDTHSVSRVNFRVAETLSRTRIWSSSKKILLHFRVVWQLSGEQHWSYAECSAKNAVGSVVTYDYDAFGNLIHSTGTTLNNYLFAGEQFDPDLNLYYNRARYLNVSTGRFWSVDTDEGKDEQPLSLHKYLYAGGDSVNKSDPSGHDFSIVEALTVAVVITVLAAIPTAHDSIGTGTPTYEPPFEKVTKDPKLGFFKQFRVMIHTQGDANRFLVVQWVKGSLARDGHYGILDIHQGEPNYPYYFPNWVIDSASQLAEYPGYPPGPDGTSLTKNGAWIKFYDEPQSDRAHIRTPPRWISE